MVGRLDFGEEEHIEVPALDRAYLGDLGSDPVCIPLPAWARQQQCCHNGCQCCSDTKVGALWRPQGQEPQKTFLGILQVQRADGTIFWKLDSPVDFLRDGTDDKLASGKDLDTFLPGHEMNYWEWM